LGKLFIDVVVKTSRCQQDPVSSRVGHRGRYLSPRRVWSPAEGREKEARTEDKCGKLLGDHLKPSELLVGGSGQPEEARDNTARCATVLSLVSAIGR